MPLTGGHWDMHWAPGKLSPTGLTLSSSSTGDCPPTTGSTGMTQPVPRTAICATSVKRRKSTCFGVHTPSVKLSEIRSRQLSVPGFRSTLLHPSASSSLQDFSNGRSTSVSQEPLLLLNPLSTVQPLSTRLPLDGTNFGMAVSAHGG